MLKRKIDEFLKDWKNNPNRLPLIIYGARQVGKTTSIEAFAKQNYQNIVEINFYENPEYMECFSNFNVDEIIKNISYINPDFRFIPNQTLIFFDEIQEFKNVTTSLKFFAIDGRFDVIASGSMLGTKSGNITSVAVGYKEEYQMYTLDFEEYLINLGYGENLFEDLLNKMINLEPLDNVLYKKLESHFLDFINIGGYPKAVNSFLTNKNFDGIYNTQKSLVRDYREDISKYLTGLDIAKAQRVYDSLTPQLAKDNHKFQFTKLGHGSRFKDYFEVTSWLENAGIIYQAYNLENIESPLKGNYSIDNYRLYYTDTSLLIATLNSIALNDYKFNNNLNIYNGALMENVLAISLVKQGFDLYFYRNNDSTVELDFIIEGKDSLIPLEVKAKKGKTRSLNTVLCNYDYPFKEGIKFSLNNIGKSNNIITFPIFLSFLLKEYINKR